MTAIPLNETLMKALRGGASCRLISIAAVLVVGWVFVFLSALTQATVSKDQVEWFSRSGSVLTVAALFATVWLAGLKPFLVGEGGYAGREGLAVYAEVKPLQTAAFWFSHISATAGTIVWGYGDLFFAWLSGS